MPGYRCPFCHQFITLNDDNEKMMFFCFDGYSANLQYALLNYRNNADELLSLTFVKCPNPECNEISVNLQGHGKNLKGLDVPIRPKSNAKSFPLYIPSQIRNDYEEAYSILYLSPKASATLSRRCLQGMIRDFWGIKESTLNKEILKLQDRVSHELWAVLNGVRQLGNIGAHMEQDINVIVDIDPQEAEKLIKLIELLINDWYITRHNQENLYNDIVTINKEKQEARKSKE